ncbi:MAG: YitT family protein [Clostridia bacterium]|nr:YitT family protein [Clostridia bacterium]
MQKLWNKKLWIDCLVVPFGTALLALGIVLFNIPNDIAPGGVSGLATALSAWMNGRVSVGMLSLALNLPLFVLALVRFGLRPLTGTLASTVLLSFMIDGFGLFIPGYTGNTLLAAVFGGVLSGAGMGLLLRRGYTTGGTDLLSALLNSRNPNLPVARLLLIIDAAVVGVAVLIFRNIEVGLYSVVAIFVTTKVIDGILVGADTERVLYVITGRGAEITAKLEEMDLGVTLVEATGGYTGEGRQMLVVVTHRNQFAQALAAAKAIDPAAFMFVSNATEVHGEGFKPIA